MREFAGVVVLIVLVTAMLVALCVGLAVTFPTVQPDPIPISNYTEKHPVDTYCIQGRMVYNEGKPTIIVIDKTTKCNE